MDCLAWALPLHELWENYVEAQVRREASLVGGIVSVGRKRETVFPLEWTDPSHRSLGHLVPDIVVLTRNAVHVVDAKYKAHLAELDEQGWQRFTDDAREAPESPSAPNESSEDRACANLVSWRFLKYLPRCPSFLSQTVQASDFTTKAPGKLVPTERGAVAVRARPGAGDA